MNATIEDSKTEAPSSGDLSIVAAGWWGFYLESTMGRPRKKPVYVDGEKKWECSICKKPKDESCFSINNRTSNGLRSQCKECLNPIKATAARAHYHANIQAHREMDRNRRVLEREKRRAAENARYQKNKPSILAKNAARRKANPNKPRAQDALNCAIRRGNIIRPTRCEVCHSEEGTMHGHHDSYDPERWLVATFMCRRCHAWTHARRADQAKGIWE